MNFSLFSQTDTTQTKTVVLTGEVAKKVVQDLVRLDRVEGENIRLTSLTGMYKNKIDYLEGLTITLEQSNQQQKSVIGLQKEQITLKNRQVTVFEDLYKSEKRKKTLYLFLGILSTVGLSSLLLTQ